MSRAFILTIPVAFGCFFGVASGADAPVRTVRPAMEWPQWRGADRSGISPDTGLLKDWTAQPPKLLWTGEGMGSGFASVAVAGGRIYTAGNEADGQVVVCVNAADGKVVWKKIVTSVIPRHGSATQEGSRCTPSIDGERLYVISVDGKIACLKATDGSEIWSKDFESEWKGKKPNWGFSESPLVDGDRVLCTPGGSAAMMVALDKLTGKEIWRTEYPTSLGEIGRAEAGYSSIVISHACGEKQYVQLVGKGVVGVRASDGKFLWGYNRVANRTASIPTPIIDGDYVFASSGYQTGAVLLKLVKAAEGIECEEQYFLPGKTLQNHHGQMILKDGYIYCGHGHGNGIPICVEMATGKVVWGGTQRGAGSGSAAIAYADGRLIFRYQSGEVALIEATPSEYRLQGVFKPPHVSPPCWSHPVVIGGRMYLRDHDKLMCYDLRAAP